MIKNYFSKKLSQKRDKIIKFEKIITTMNATQQIREQLGLSQQDLAMYLLIPLSQLAMYETGKRELPAATSIKLAELLTLFNQSQKNTKAKNELIKAQQLEVNKKLSIQAKDLEYQLIKEQRKLVTLQKKFKQNSNLKALVNLLPENNKQLNELFAKQAQNGLQKNSLALQTQQLVKIEGIKSQLQFIQKMLETKK